MINNTYKNIYLVRHPKTEAPDGMCYGNSEVLPHEESLRIAVEKVRAKMQDVLPDSCYSSPLKRCSWLADALMGSENVLLDELLREIDFADWEMKPWKDIPQEQQEEWGRDFVNCKIHGGENFFDVQSRVIRFWQKLMLTDDKEILIISHAGILRALLAYLLEAAPQKIFAIEVDYGDVIQVKWSDEAYYKIKFL